MNNKGLRILNTRPENQNQSLSKVITTAGGKSIELPVLGIKPLNNWLQSLPALESISKSIFISANAVSLFFDELRKKGIIWPASISNIVIGKATAQALENKGFRADIVPEMANSENLLQMPELKSVDNQLIIQVKGESGRPLIAETLLDRGAQVISLAVYERVIPNHSQAKLDSLWQDNEVDIILFTSQQAIYNLFAIFNEDSRAWLRSKPCLVISERIAAAASLMGMQSIRVCQYEQLKETLHQLCRAS